MITRRDALKNSAAILASLTCPTLLASAGVTSPKANVLVYSGNAFGSRWHLSLAEPLDPMIAVKTITRVVEKIDFLMSPYRSDSELTRFNNLTKGSALVSTHLANVAQASLAVAEQSNGAFDPTIGPLVNRYGFSPIKGKLDSHFSDLSLKQNILSKKNKQTTLDFCGIAKGYALDLIDSSLQSSGYTDFLLELGGELIARGSHPSGRAWQIQIESPNHSVLSGLTGVLRDTSIATSGISNNSYVLNSRRYSHLVNRNDSEQKQSDLYSVSVMHSSAMFADAWSTALFVLGHKHGLALANKLSLDTLFIEESGSQDKTTTSGGFSRYFNT